MSAAQKKKLALLLWSVTPDEPERCASVFVYAAAAAAMDCEVELHFSGAAVQLLVPGVAEKLMVGSAERRSVYAHMQDAARLGARFLGCAMALHAQHLDAVALIPEYAGAAGATAFVVKSLDPEWSTLVF
jgi:predicted peroxiredoxin